MFMRYNTTSDTDKIEALQRTATHLASQPKKPEEGEKVTQMPDHSPPRQFENTDDCGNVGRAA